MMTLSEVGSFLLTGGGNILIISPDRHDSVPFGERWLEMINRIHPSVVMGSTLTLTPPIKQFSDLEFSLKRSSKGCSDVGDIASFYDFMIKLFELSQQSQSMIILKCVGGKNCTIIQTADSVMEIMFVTKFDTTSMRRDLAKENVTLIMIIIAGLIFYPFITSIPPGDNLSVYSSHFIFSIKVWRLK